MKYLLANLSLFIAASLFLGGCGQKKAVEEVVPEEERHNSVYYWKTSFDLDSTELSFLQKHDIDRIYLRMFDVAVEQDVQTGKIDVVPIATTKFVSRLPDSVEIVPVTYITIDALRAMARKEREYASLITERLLAMSSYNECGKINEIQLDCDWTSKTKDSYNTLCKAVKDNLNTQGISLSVTVRLHQLREEPPAADKGVLMLYNTGASKERDTRNSILDIDDVDLYMPYSGFLKYPLPLSYAYPLFGWGVKFNGDNFVSIVSEQDTVTVKGEYIRHERPSYEEIAAVKALVEKNLGKPSTGNILYHLDNNQFKNYTTDEINQILSR